MGAVSFFCSLKRLQSFLCFAETAESEILESNDVASVHVYRHVVVPYVPGILHGLVVAQIAGDTSRIVVVWIQAVYLESFRSDFCSRVFCVVGCFGGPDAFLVVWIVCPDNHFSAFFHRFLIPLDGNGSNDRLTGKPKSTWWAMIEHIPLTVDFL